jgi:hypothetical protein
MGVMLSVVMDKFCKGKVFNPCFGVSLAVDLKVGFQFLIKMFGPSISLRVISGGGCDGVVKKLSKGTRELWYELGVSIQDDLIIKSKLLVDMFEKKFGYPFWRDCLQARNNNYPLTKAMVYHDHDRVKTPWRRKISDEVHR